MKLKDVFLGVLIVALIASEALLFLAKQHEHDARTRLSTALYDAQKAHTDLEQFKATAETTQAALHDDNQALTRKVSQLQAENKRLQDENQRVAQQLGTARQAVQLQQQHLQQLQTDQPSPTDADRAACINNLRQIESAKNQWALELNKTAADTPTETDLLPYLPGGVFPVCPSGGSYTVGNVGTPPSCSVPGHVLPQQ